MLKPEQVPKDAIAAARDALEKCNGGQQFYLNEVAPAIAAALSAWPGAFLYPLNKTRLILPLPPQEKRDDERD